MRRHFRGNFDIHMQQECESSIYILEITGKLLASFCTPKARYRIYLKMIEYFTSVIIQMFTP